MSTNITPLGDEKVDDLRAGRSRDLARSGQGAFSAFAFHPHRRLITLGLLLCEVYVHQRPNPMEPSLLSPNQNLPLLSALPAPTSNSLPHEPAPSVPCTNDNAPSPPAPPRTHFKTITLTAAHKLPREEPVESPTVELPTPNELGMPVPSSPREHEVSDSPVLAPAAMSPIKLGLVALALFLVSGLVGFVLGQLRTTPSATAPAIPSTTVPCK